MVYDHAGNTREIDATDTLATDLRSNAGPQLSPTADDATHETRIFTTGPRPDYTLGVLLHAPEQTDALLAEILRRPGHNVLQFMH